MKEEFIPPPLYKEVNLLKRNHLRKRMIERNISFSEEEHLLLVSWDPYSHAETHLPVHALSFLFAVFKVAVNKEGAPPISTRVQRSRGSPHKQ